MQVVALERPAPAVPGRTRRTPGTASRSSGQENRFVALCHPFWVSASRFDDSLAFDHREDSIHGRKANFFLRPARPLKLHLVYFLGGAQAEVQARVGTRGIASAARNVSALAESRGSEKHLGADGIAGAFGSTQQLQSHPRMGI